MKSLWIAIEKTIFIMAVIHLIIITIEALTSGKYYMLHIANILDLEYILHNFHYTIFNGVLFFLPVLAFFLYNYFRAKKNLKKRPAEKK